MNNPWGNNFPSQVSSPALGTTTSAFPLAPAIGAGANLLSNLFNIGARKKQHKRNIEIWQMQNAYNHPSAQMARLREAGLNPNMLYGQGVKGATGQSSSAPEVAPRTPPPNLSEAFTQYQNTETSGLQNDNLRATNTLLKQDSILKTLDAVNKTGKNKAQKLVNNQLEDFLQTQVNGMKVTNRLKQSQSALNYTEHDILSRIGDERVEMFLIQLENAKKLGTLRETQNRIQTELEKFTSSNQAIGILSKLASMFK